MARSLSPTATALIPFGATLWTVRSAARRRKRLTEGVSRNERVNAPYSRAFENFVEAADGDEDVVGLLAYALFKQAIREEATQGAASARDKRNPSATTVKTYRAAAEQLITGVVGRAIDGATPEIQHSAMLAAIDRSQSEIAAHIDSRTSFGSALLTNLIAWVITLAIAVCILLIAAKPSVEQALVKVADDQAAPHDTEDSK